jgi:hypothetical protein
MDQEVQRTTKIIQRLVTATLVDPVRYWTASSGERVAIAMTLDRPDLLREQSWTLLTAADRLSRVWRQAALAVQRELLPEEVALGRELNFWKCRADQGDDEDGIPDVIKPGEIERQKVLQVLSNAINIDNLPGSTSQRITVCLATGRLAELPNPYSKCEDAWTPRGTTPAFGRTIGAFDLSVHKRSSPHATADTSWVWYVSLAKPSRFTGEHGDVHCDTTATAEEAKHAAEQFVADLCRQALSELGITRLHADGT